MSTTESRRIPVVLSGYGGVGASYAQQLCSRVDELERRHGVRLRLAAIRGRSTECPVEDGRVPPRSRWRPARPPEGLLAGTGAAVLPPAIPSSPEGGGAASQDRRPRPRGGA